MKKPKEPVLPVPEHLQPETRTWVEAVLHGYILEESDRRLLFLAAESWDRTQQAREALAATGLTYTDRFGAPRLRPEIAVERDSRFAFLRCMKQLNLDVSPPEAPIGRK